MFDVPFPDWLTLFHNIVGRADEAARLTLRLVRRPTSPFEQQRARQTGVALVEEIEGKEFVVKWLERQTAVEVQDETSRATIAKNATAIEDWVSAGLDASRLAEAHRNLREIENEFRRAAAAIVATRSADELNVAFVSEFYVADQRNVGTSIGAKAQAADLGIEPGRALRLAEQYEYDGLLDKVRTTNAEAFYRITVAGRKWVEEQIQGSQRPSTSAMPWWMRVDDDPNQKWEQLGSKRVYDRNASDAGKVATVDQPLSLLFIDFDNLKKINTQYGNPQADRLLGSVIDVIARVVHGKGRAYLHGNGDEFAVLLPNCSLSEAMATAERICNECRRISVSGLPPPSVSIGAATWPLHATDLAALEQLANAAQRTAKDQGKDRAVAAPVPEGTI